MAEKSIIMTTSRLTPFNAYVNVHGMSRSRGQKSNRLLRNFDDNLFTQHPSEYLRNEDLRLEKRLDQRTKVQWEAALQTSISSEDGHSKTFLQTTIFYTIIVLIVMLRRLDSCRST